MCPQQEFLENHQDFNPVCGGSSESTTGPQLHKQRYGSNKDTHTHKHRCRLPKHRPVVSGLCVVISSRASRRCLWALISKACQVICLIWLNTGFCVETLDAFAKLHIQHICMLRKSEWLELFKQSCCHLLFGSTFPQDRSLNDTVLHNTICRANSNRTC